ncbi:MAG: YceH family protein [Rhodoferax sp.]
MLLSAAEARVLGTLMEKARTVPDSYPLSLNALQLGCNQKSSREPLMALSEADIAGALDTLAGLHLVRSSSAGRVARFEHNFQRGVGVPEQSAVLLGLLMLRGPQTAGELRLNAERWYRFADISSVEAFLDEMQERPADRGGALVRKLPRAPGAREQRWAHLLCGAVADPTGASTAAPGDGEADLGSRVAALETELAQLRQSVQ